MPPLKSEGLRSCSCCSELFSNGKLGPGGGVTLRARAGEQNNSILSLKEGQKGRSQKNKEQGRIKANAVSAAPCNLPRPLPPAPLPSYTGRALVARPGRPLPAQEVITPSTFGRIQLLLVSLTLCIASPWAAPGSSHLCVWPSQKLSLLLPPMPPYLSPWEKVWLIHRASGL